jgi:predicted dehydrogenase
MRFALVGDHPDGLRTARALAATGRHSVVVVCGTAAEFEGARRTGDLEDVLADPQVEAVIVAGPPGDRLAQLRRVLQSERHALCVHPVDQKPDGAYEMNMLQGDVHQVVLPLLPEPFHPGFVKLVELAGGPEAPFGRPRLVEVERRETGEVLALGDAGRRNPSLPGWDLLRRIGGEIAEVFAFAAKEEAEPGEPILLNGRFERGGLFRSLLLPRQPEALFRLHVLGEAGTAEWVFPQGCDGPSELTWGGSDTRHHLTWPAFDPWPAVVAAFEQAIADWSIAARPAPAAGAEPSKRLTVSWQDEVRCLELDDAARRSLERRRASTLDYQEASEEVGFKGTMTLVGCLMLWSVLGLVLLSAIFPALGWLIIPVLFAFLGLQLLRWVVPPSRPRAQAPRE